MTNRKRFFERNKNIANRVIRGQLAKNKIGIVHGTRATNAQLPSFLKRKTRDWDVFVRRPGLRALQLERALDRKFGGDFFRVKKGKGSPGVKVFKIKSNITDEGFVDFATIKRKVPFVSKRGVKFATLADQKMIASMNVRNPAKAFRREKDQDLLTRIKIFEKQRGRKIR